ncbi:site-specific integrase [bacterium]|nr:site-specific integrase [bacterium]
MPKRNHVKGYAGVWYLDSTVPGSDPPRPDKVYYITYRVSGERKSYDEKIGRESDRIGRMRKWTPDKVAGIRLQRMTGATTPKAEVRRQEAEEEANKPITFGEYAKDWLDGHVATNLKPSSKRGYESLLDNLILPALKDRPLAEIARDEIKELCFALLQEGRKVPKKTEDKKVKDPTLSARTVVYAVRTISAIYNHAIEDGIVAANPALRPGRFIKIGSRREKVDILSPAEGDLVLKTAEKYYGRTFPLLLCAMRTGMRQGELIALEWGDIDWNGNFIEVRRSTWRGITGTPKSGKTRRVDMNDRLKAVLLQHQTRVKAEALKAGVTVPAQVFVTDELTPYDGVNVRKRFEVVLRKAKLRKIRFHDLRHSYASWLIANKESLAYVRDQLGHHSIQITVDLYGHLVPGENREAVNRLDAPQVAQVVANE